MHRHECGWVDCYQFRYSLVPFRVISRNLRKVCGSVQMQYQQLVHRKRTALPIINWQGRITMDSDGSVLNESNPQKITAIPIATYLFIGIFLTPYQATDKSQN
jgi:hypothetical protein